MVLIGILGVVVVFQDISKYFPKFYSASVKNGRIEKEKRYKGITRILPLYFYFFFQTVLKFKNSKDG